MELIICPPCLPSSHSPRSSIPSSLLAQNPFLVLLPPHASGIFSKLLLSLEPSCVACCQFSPGRLLDERLAVRSCGFSLLDRYISCSCEQRKEATILAHSFSSFSFLVCIADVVAADSEDPPWFSSPFPTASACHEH